MAPPIRCRLFDAQTMGLGFNQSGRSHTLHLRCT